MEFKLLDHQLPHLERVVELITSGPGYVDTSTMGCGKTYVTCMVAWLFSLKMIVICPKTVKAVWRKVASAADVEILDLMTYQSVSSKLEKQPYHGLLHKEMRALKSRTFPYFSVTKKYEDLLKEGCLLVVDEVQFTRNNTAQYRAIQTLVKTIARSSNPSKYALLSATPFDKAPQAINLMKMIGIITQEEMFVRSRPTGWRELLLYCQSKEPELTTQILSEKEEGNHKSTYDACAFRLYSKIVRKHVCSAMPLIIDAPCDAKNGYYRVAEDQKKAFLSALRALEMAAVKVKDPTLPRKAGDSFFAELTSAMVQLETLKIPLFERMARKYLTADPTCKVVIAIHYLNTMYTLENSLRTFFPEILHGEMDEEEREFVVDRFQHEPSCRLFLCISRVGGVGISLHDTSGDSPRILLLSPDFNLIDTHQATGRVYRVGTKSPTLIRLVYANIGDQERNVHRILIQKSTILRSILEEYTRNEVLLPIDYDEEYEE